MFPSLFAGVRPLLGERRFFLLRDRIPPAESREIGGSGGRSRSQCLPGRRPPSRPGGRRPQWSKERGGPTGYDRAVCSSPRSPPPLFGDGRPSAPGLLITSPSKLIAVYLIYSLSPFPKNAKGRATPTEKPWTQRAP